MPKRTCSVEGCGKPHQARGWCPMHYGRWQVHGDPFYVDTPVARFWRRVRLQPLGACWIWTGPRLKTGYGQHNAGGGRNARAHRFAYELLIGPIPDGADLDHQCHNADRSCRGGETCPHRLCVNPLHLEPVPRLVNARRGRQNGATHTNSRKTHCPQGHPYDDENTYIIPSTGGRLCRTCDYNRKHAA